MTDEKVIETLKHAIANLYYYVEAHDDEEYNELLFRYNIPISRHDNIIISSHSEDDNDTELKKYIRSLIERKLGITTFKVKDYQIHSDPRNRYDILICAIEMSRDEYLNCIYNRLYDIIPVVDYMCRYDHLVDLESVGMKYGIFPYNILRPVDVPDVPDFNERLY